MAMSMRPMSTPVVGGAPGWVGGPMAVSKPPFALGLYRSGLSTYANVPLG